MIGSVRITGHPRTLVREYLATSGETDANVVPPRAGGAAGSLADRGRLLLGPDLRVLILLEYPGVSPRGSLMKAQW